MEAIEGEGWRIVPGAEAWLLLRRDAGGRWLGWEESPDPARLLRLALGIQTEATA